MFDPVAGKVRCGKLVLAAMSLLKVDVLSDAILSPVDQVVFGGTS